jgi:1,4-dihydroxy-2-naphthoyl-CoA synthase
MAITEIRRLMQTDDAKESAAAFIEKRNPVFTGK